MSKKIVEFSKEIASQMYHLYFRENWTFKEISRWLWDLHQIRYSLGSVHRYLTSMHRLKNELIETNACTIEEQIDSKTLLKQLQRDAYHRSLAGNQQKNDRKWRESAQIFLAATSLLLRQGEWEESDDEQQEGNGLPTFVVASPLPS